MLTQAIPSLVTALSQALPQNVVSQIASALGQCAAPVTHRAGMNVQPNTYQQAINRNGTYPGGGWNPSDFPGLLPSMEQIGNLGVFNNQQLQNFVDVNNYSSDNSSHYYGGSNFNFPTTNDFSISEYYGGPTNYFGGNTQFTNTFSTNVNTTNINTTTINGEAAPGTPGARGPAGPAGSAGAAGQNGASGAPGRPGFPGASGLPGGRGLTGAAGRAGTAGRDGKDGDNYDVRYEDKQIPITVYEFNPSTCSSDPVESTITIQVPVMKRIKAKGEWDPPWDR